MKDLLRAPWSDQPLRSGVRLLAWLFVVCGVSAIGIIGYFMAIEGLPRDMPLQFYALFLAVVYMTALVLSSAIHGKAPHGWIPWQTRTSRSSDTNGSRAS